MTRDAAAFKRTVLRRDPCIFKHEPAGPCPRQTRGPGLDPGDGGTMKTFVLAALGTIAGLVLGAAVGILAGIAWVNIASTSDFEGQSAMLVFFTFAPAGSVLGGLIGAIWAGFLASKSRIRMEGDT